MSSPRLIIIPLSGKLLEAENLNPPCLSFSKYAFITPEGKDASDKYHKTDPWRKIIAAAQR
jgi:hypothetical protein